MPPGANVKQLDGLNCVEGAEFEPPVKEAVEKSYKSCKNSVKIMSMFSFQALTELYSQPSLLL